MRWSNIFHIAWLPDGTGLLVGGVDQLNNNERLFLLSYPSGELRPLSDEFSNFGGFSITADGSKIVTAQDQSPGDIWLQSLTEPANARKLTSVSGEYRYVTFLPDNRIIYQLDKDLWLSGIDNSQPRQLTFGAGNNSNPASGRLTGGTYFMRTGRTCGSNQ